MFVRNQTIVNDKQLGCIILRIRFRLSQCRETVGLGNVVVQTVASQVQH